MTTNTSKPPSSSDRFKGWGGQKLNTGKRVVEILLTLPPKSREILERRFGISGHSPETLESIGRSYNITRERVRQIQEYGLRKLNSEDSRESLGPVFNAVEEFISKNCGVVSEKRLFENFVSKSEAPHFFLALRLMPNILCAQETDDFCARYASSKQYLDSIDSLLNRVHAKIGKVGKPMKFSALTALAKEEIPQERPMTPGQLIDILGLSKRIQDGPFGEYGLSSWPSIRPRGVRDKAYLVFKKEEKHLHFKELSNLIDKHFKGTALSRKTHPQTVHNELIKDARFVLIGRGLYALSEWGYESGTVKDVLIKIFEENGKGLNKDEVLELISTRRVVKPNTVFLNLQNKEYFNRRGDGRYYLV